jgi:hypothetical protein
MTTSHVLVIDDSERFAVHVWRCIAGYPGFGYEGIFQSVDQGEAGSCLSRVCVDDGRTVVWWIRAASTKKAEEAFAEFHRRTQGETENIELVLLDRVGRTGKEPYSWYEIYKQVTTHVSRERVCVVSAYRAGVETPEGKGESIMTTPKLQSKLVKLLRKYTNAPLLKGIEDCARNLVDGNLHVLVTGAGFEMGSTRDGLGQPHTRVALKSMWERLRSARRNLSPISLPNTYPARGFPVVQIGEKQSPQLVQHAGEENLDDYFSWIFRSVRGSVDVVSSTDETLASARKLELEIRRSFRSSLLESDWGQLYQCAIAARLPWLAWISTNYTGFADRAIEALPPREGISRWEIVSGAEEARRLYDQMLDKAFNFSEHREFVPLPRILFKVHGGIGDVRTMALAADDKRAESLLLAPVQGLYSLYGAAQQFLMTTLATKDASDNQRVVFHIVGHNLFDVNLLGLLAQANKHLRARRGEAWFIIVNPDIFDASGDSKKGVLSRLYEGLGKFGEHLQAHQVFVVPSTAREYMSRLAQNWSMLHAASGIEQYDRILDREWKWRHWPSLESVKHTMASQEKYKSGWKSKKS